VFIVVDALDELHERHSILELLSDLSDISQTPHHVLVTSRRTSDLEDAMGFFNQITMSPDDTKKDMELYIRHHASRSRWGKLPEFEAILHDLIERADGMYAIPQSSCVVKLKELRTLIYAE
jgi:hypothetical protein